MRYTKTDFSGRPATLGEANPARPFYNRRTAAPGRQHEEQGMASVTVEFPEDMTLAKLDPALRQLADALCCDVWLGANGTYRVVPREKNVIRMPAQVRIVSESTGPGAA